VRLKTGRTFVISLVLNQADDMSDYARRLIMGISQALRDSVNLVYIRLMRDIVSHYLYRPGALA